MTKRLLLTISVLAASLAAPLLSFAAGTITGKVTYSSTKPVKFLASLSRTWSALQLRR